MILPLLRARTEAVHQRVEAGLPLLDPDLTRDRYLRLLARFWGFYGPVEQTLDCLRPDRALGLSDHPLRRGKVALLRRDLAVLGVTDPERLPQCRALPPLRDVSEAVGCMYVLEGSTLGGQVIGRHLRASLGLGTEEGASFWSSYGAEVGPRWKEFCAALQRFGERGSPEVRERIVAGATDTFECLEQWLLTPS